VLGYLTAWQVDISLYPSVCGGLLDRYAAVCPRPLDGLIVSVVSIGILLLSSTLISGRQCRPPKPFATIAPCGATNAFGGPRS